VGQATDRKLTEIEETRRRVEYDLRELEARIPPPLRSAKKLAGMVVGSTALTALAVRLLKGRKKDRPSAEVVVRVVRDDVVEPTPRSSKR
jgi:hypothetical protein